MIDNKNIGIGTQETQEEDSGLFVCKLKEPITYNGKRIEKLTFNWDKLNGQDCMAVEEELRIKGVLLVAPQYVVTYLVGIATRACEEKVGADIFEQLPASVFLKIRKATQNFLMTAV